MEYLLDGEIIIREVEKHTCLYDIKHNDFKIRELRTAAWTEVAKNVVGDKWDLMDENTQSEVAKEVQRRWKNMKDSFYKNFKDEKRSIPGKKFRKPYVYHKHMSFLRDYFEARVDSEQTSTENSVSPKQDAQQRQKNVTRNVEVDNELSLDDSNSSSTNHHLVVFNDGTTQMVPAKRLKTDYFSCPENFILQPPKTKTVSEDSNELFLRSLLPDISKLNPTKLRHFKTFVITKLTNLLDEQDAETATRDVTDDLKNPYVLESCSIES